MLPVRRHGEPSTPCPVEAIGGTLATGAASPSSRQMIRREPIGAGEVRYLLLLQPEPEGGFTVTCPAGAGELRRHAGLGADDGRGRDRGLRGLPTRGRRARAAKRYRGPVKAAERLSYLSCS